jgi:hypothetical protein
MLEDEARCVVIGLLSTQLTAFLTSAAMLASSAAVNFFSAKAVGRGFAPATQPVRGT